jgi:uncharacterized small protein (DUF1192 family)
MIICILCTSGRGTGGLLYNHKMNWFSEEPEPPEECPQCGSSLGLFTLTHDQPAAVAVAAETLLAQREEIERLRAENERLKAERAALLTPVEGVDPEEATDLGKVLKMAAARAKLAGTFQTAWTVAQGGEYLGLGEELAARASALAHEVVRLRAAQQDTFKDGQIAALEKTTPIVNDIAAQRDSAERRAQALAARLAALEPVLNDMAMILGLEVVAPATPEEGQAVATKLWQYAKANEETRLALLAELGDIKGAPSARWTTDGHNWYGARPDGGMDKIERWSNLNGDGTIKHGRGWTEIDRFGFEKDRGRFGLARAAMIAANAALSADASNKPERSS